jgi:exodeoxyribonuclease VII small subunit
MEVLNFERFFSHPRLTARAAADTIRPDMGPPHEPGVRDREAPQELPFERALERLEEIAQRLEAGDLELEAALAAFEEGVGLARRCAEQLREAERRIEVLTREGDGWSERSFQVTGDEGS